MRIDSVEAVPLVCPLERTARHAGFTLTNRAMVLIRVRTSDGVVGVGESGCVNSSPHAVREIIDRELAPVVLGENPLERGRLWNAMESATRAHGGPGIVMHAISGVDIALWDVAAQVAGLPLWQFLGGVSSAVAAYATGGLYEDGKDAAATADEMASLVAMGFRTVKLKVGLSSNDLDRITAVRAAIGPEVGLILDANSAYSPKDALSLLRQVEAQKIRFLEEPVPADDTTGLAEVRAQSTVPIAAGENLACLPAYRALLRERAVDIVQADATRCGGIGPLRDIAALAAAFQVDFMPHAFSSSVCLAANLHVAAAVGASLVEVDGTPNPLRTQLCAEEFRPGEDGRIAPPLAPGLGVHVDPEIILRYQV